MLLSRHGDKSISGALVRSPRRGRDGSFEVIWDERRMLGYEPLEKCAVAGAVEGFVCIGNGK